MPLEDTQISLMSHLWAIRQQNGTYVLSDDALLNLIGAAYCEGSMDGEREALERLDKIMDLRKST